MKLTKKKAIEISIELWTDLAETGGEKEDWEGWKRYGEMDAGCALCEYDLQQVKTHKAGDVCLYCPYFKKFGGCYEDGLPFANWDKARTGAERKKYARLFLEQLRTL